MTRRLTRWIARVTGLAVVLAAGTVASQASPAAAATCPARTLSKPFSSFGDTNDYFLAPDATFESGTGSWALSSASVVSGNEPWKVFGSTHAKSLKLNASGTATTPSMCIATAEDSMRFFYRSPGVAGAKLHVHIHVTSGVNVATNDYDVDGTVAGWAVSQRIMLPDIRDASGMQTITITFQPRNSSTATWQLDDVSIDPWRTG